MHITNKLILCLGCCLFLSPETGFAQEAIEIIVQEKAVQNKAVQEKAVQKVVTKSDQSKTSKGKKQSKAKTKKKPKEKKVSLLERIEKLDALIAKTTGKKNKRNRKSEKTLHIFPESPYIGQVYSSTKQKYHAYLAVEVKFLNKTSKKITLKHEDFQLKANAKILKLKDISSDISRNSFNDGKRSHSFKTFKVKEPVVVAAGGEAKKTLLFTDLPRGGEIPNLVLTVNFQNKEGKAQQQNLDLNLIAKSRLKMTVQRMGPGECMGFLEIGGKLSSVGVGSLVKEIDSLAGKGVGRFVVSWTKDAPKMDSSVINWLQQELNKIYYRNNTSSNSVFPSLPGSTNEFHLASLPKNNNLSNYSRNRKKIIHVTRYSAFRAALKTAYQSIPAEQVLTEVQNGHPFCRSIALDVAGYKLKKNQLAYILALSRDKKDSNLQYAALKTLGQFQEALASQRLLEVVALKDKKLSGIAVMSLLSSRFSGVRDSLIQFYESAPEDQKAFVLEILIKNPNPQWSDTIYASMTKSKNSITLEGLQALNAMGHPKLLAVLEQALENKDSKIKTEAVRQLVSRKDLASRQLATKYIFDVLKKGKIDTQTINLLKKTNDSRAVPLILKHLKKTKTNKRAMITVLGALGDQTVGEELAKLYPKLNSSEKSAALKVLIELQSEYFLKFAKEAFQSKTNSSIASAAARGLMENGSEEAQQIMIEALNSTKNTSAMSYLCNYLGQLGTDKAKMALIKARSSSNKTKQRSAVSALRNMRNRSPGNQFKYRAAQFLLEKKWSQAEKTFSMAIKLDNSISEFYVGRGKVYLELKKPKKAYNDFQKGFELDPFDPEAVGYLAIFDLREGNIKKGIAFLRDHKKKFESDNKFIYLSARVYALALARVQMKPKNSEHDKQAKDYQKKAIELLKKAVKKGFRDYKRIKEEPDFKPLKDDPEFQAILKGKIDKKKKGNRKLAIPAQAIEIRIK